MNKLLNIHTIARRTASVKKAQAPRIKLVCVWIRDPLTGKLRASWHEARDSEPSSFVFTEWGRPPSSYLFAA